MNHDYAYPGEWIRWAACRGRVQQMAMPDQVRDYDDGRRSGHRNLTVRQRAHITVARSVCLGCPVLADCKAWALTLPDPAKGMVAGGLTPTQRDAARARDAAK